MKKLIACFPLLLLFHAVLAQPWMPSGASRVKFSDVYGRHAVGSKGQARPAKSDDEEGTDHLFEKWAWYWQQHLDKDGYIVPPVATVENWQQYMQGRPEAKTTASLAANWIFQGPHTTGSGYWGIGRMNVVAFDPVDSNTLYVGSAAGSTWKTTDGGLSWHSLYDFLPTLGVADIKINPLNRNTVYVATGDGDAGDAYSSGIIVSHNGGTSWSTAGISWLPTAYNNARSILINPLDTNTMLLGTNAGLYITHNAGVSWTNVAPGNFKQIIYKPGDTSIVYGAIYTDTCCQIVRSVNAGYTWTAVTNFRSAQRINLAVCPASPTTAMAVISDTTSGLKGIYKSSNSGASFAAVYTNDTSCSHELLGWEIGLPTASCGGQGWYDLCIAINPSNVQEVTVGGVNTYYSGDGGLSWTVANGWYDNGTGLAVVHADKHFLGYSPLSGALFETCDGGIYKNYGPVTSPWSDLSNGICVTEFYRNAVANGVSFCIGGCQDNGSQMVNGGVATDLTGGDGMQPLINYGNPANIFYTSSQNGYINMTRDAGVHFHGITDTLHDQGGWISPYLLHPTDTETLILGYKRIYMTHNNGISWTAISPEFDSSSNINFLAWAPTNTNYIYAEYDDYNIWKSVLKYTANAGATWDTIHIPFTNFISGLAVDPKNAKHIWVTVSGYSASDKVYSYNLTTNTWVNETGSLPNLPVDCIIADTLSRTRYIGTDAAVFYKDTTMTDWALFNTHLPTVHVYDLHINYSTGEIWAATFGRGMWKSIKADNPGSLSLPEIVRPVISVSPNPSQGTFTVFCASGLFTNRSVVVRLFAPDGKEINMQSGIFDPAGNLKIDAGSVPAGFYICEVSDGTRTAYAKVVIYR